MYRRDIIAGSALGERGLATVDTRLAPMIKRDPRTKTRARMGIVVCVSAGGEVEIRKLE